MWRILVTNWKPGTLGTPLATHCCSKRANRSATAIHKNKRIANSWAELHIDHSSDSIMTRKNYWPFVQFPAQRPVTRSFDVFFDLCLNKRLSKQSSGWWFEAQSRPLWRHCDVVWQFLYDGAKFSGDFEGVWIYNYYFCNYLSSWMVRFVLSA